MRIAILEPYIEGIGGAQKVILQYAEFLKKRGHYVEIFTQRHDSKSCYEGFKNFSITTIGLKSKFFAPFSFLFKKFSGFDVIIANDWPTHFSSFLNDNVVWVCYSPKRDFYDLKDFYRRGFKSRIISFMKSLLFKKLDSALAKKVRLILPISVNVKDRIKKYYGIDAKRVFYAGINYGDFKSSEMSDYFLSVGRLVSPKRTDLIVRAMNNITTNAKLVIVGDGPEEERLKAIASRNIIFKGAVSDREKILLYSKAISLIYVPMREDWGLIPLEAAASKVTTIGAGEGGLRETIINKKTGFLLSDPSPKKISEKIDYLFQNKDIARRMGVAAFHYCKKFDWKNIFPKFEEWLEELS